MDVAVHVLLRSMDAQTYEWSVTQLSIALHAALPAPGSNLGSVGVVRGPYKPPPMRTGVRVFVHAFVGDAEQYLSNNPLARYAWTKYRAAVGSFHTVDKEVRRPTVEDAVSGPVLQRLQSVFGVGAQIEILRPTTSGQMEKVRIVTAEPPNLHEMYTSAVVFSYRHLCRALGVLDEGRTNLQLIETAGNRRRDTYGILTQPESTALLECVRSKYSLRGGELTELEPHRLSTLRQAAIDYLGSVAKRFG
jgi:hypothetical protein